MQIWDDRSRFGVVIDGSLLAGVHLTSSYELQEIRYSTVARLAVDRKSSTEYTK